MNTALPKIIEKCWICGGNASTGEHKTKSSDLRGVFGAATPAAPLFYHDARRKNQRIRSFKSSVLKFPDRLCEDCNTSRTQPHDIAWAEMSEKIRTRIPPVKSGSFVRANKIFSYNTKKEMLNTHLYFLKQFGCYLLEGWVPIDLQPFATAILDRKAHPHVYLKFYAGATFENLPMTGRSHIHVRQFPDGPITLCDWYYCVDGFAVQLIYALDEKEAVKLGGWHLRFGVKRFKITAAPHIKV